MSNTTKTLKNEISVNCKDGIVLAATVFRPVDGDVKAGVMIGTATGILQTFYAAFASNLAENGYTVITYDNRGIGASLTGHVRDCPASLQDWGELDMPAVLETLKEQAPGVPYHLIGHSAGGQLVGLMYNADSLSSMFNFACSSGNLSNMHTSFKLKAQYFMNIFIPVSNFIFGYTKSQWAGMGEPLPKAAARQWAKWCNGAGYVKTDFGQSIQKHWYDELAIPTLWLHATDDPIANKVNVEEMMSVFTNCESTLVTLDPQEQGLTDIGHMKFFSRKKMPLWSLTLDWLSPEL